MSRRYPLVSLVVGLFGTSVARAQARPAEKRVIANAGHFVHQERPDEVNRLILGYVGRAR